MSNLKGVGWCIKPHTDAPWLQDCVDWPFRRHLLEEKYSWNEVFWQPKPPLSIFDEAPRILLVFYILAWIFLLLKRYINKIIYHSGGLSPLGCFGHERLSSTPEAPPLPVFALAALLHGAPKPIFFARFSYQSASFSLPSLLECMAFAHRPSGSPLCSNHSPAMPGLRRPRGIP